MKTQRTIFIGGAWPYANGSLHVGHLAALLPGDVIARYHRLLGDNVFYVSGSDCHGTPISIRAQKENVTPLDITNKFHNEFVHCFTSLNFSYDMYSRTDDEFHMKFVQDFIELVFKNGFIYEKKVKQFFCNSCNTFLADRYIEGTCPHCNQIARGDQCDYCGALLDPENLIDPVCKTCGCTPVLKEDTQLFFSLSKFDGYMKEVLENSNLWRLNAKNETAKYVKEGLRDRPISRDLDWGIKIPIENYTDKTLYVWFDAVLGYLSDLTRLLGDYSLASGLITSSRSYFIHGKDNIPFHSIIFPCLLKAAEINFSPSVMVSSEYITLEGKKISTSKDWAIWVPDLIKKYNTDAIRYYLLANSPERKDGNFSWNDFFYANNSELLGAWGNLVNRTLVFINKYFDGEVKSFTMDKNISNIIKELFDTTGSEIEHANIKNALREIFSVIREINKYFDESKPWITIKNDYDACNNTIFTCAEAILNLAILLEPFLPKSSEKIFINFDLSTVAWKYTPLPFDVKLNAISILFERLDNSTIIAERENLNK